ncbi:uncharacterized protein DSM5745_00750 [Aspergillus mulundensis]|uniref:Uncharacterized protein n=1 Tax=Aspergillus mulundensis TaxID=1810919 RepID=A0A3D8T5Y6_9EURO|nr:hypothetical protein DSM5745_00750 [Aspergillus mulundensis]RDW93428.1 hypothetical protein DSM5745_00750 [Aspergillus mulundensis]
MTLPTETAAGMAVNAPQEEGSMIKEGTRWSPADITLLQQLRAKDPDCLQSDFAKKHASRFSRKHTSIAAKLSFIKTRQIPRERMPEGLSTASSSPLGKRLHQSDTEDQDAGAERRSRQCIEGKHHESENYNASERTPGDAANPIVLDDTPADEAMFESPAAENSQAAHKNEEQLKGSNDQQKLKVVTLRYRGSSATSSSASNGPEASECSTGPSLMRQETERPNADREVIEGSFFGQYKSPPSVIEKLDPMYANRLAFSPGESVARSLPQKEEGPGSSWEPLDLIDWAKHKLSPSLARTLAVKASRLGSSQVRTASQSKPPNKPELPELLQPLREISTVGSPGHNGDLSELKAAFDQKLKELKAAYEKKLEDLESRLNGKLKVLEADGFKFVDNTMHTLNQKVDAMALEKSAISKFEKKLDRLARFVEDLPYNND